MSDTTLQDIYGVAGTVWCVSATGSDSNAGTAWTAAFATPTKAVSVASAGDLIIVGPGTFSLGSAGLNLPTSVSLFGAGIYQTTLTSSYGTGAIVCPGTGSVIQDMTIQATLTGNYAYPVGAITSGGQSIATNCILKRLKLIADTDGILLNCNTASPGAVQWDMYDIDFSTKWDAINATNLHTGNQWPGLVLNLYGPRSSVVGPSSVGAGAPTSRGLILNTGGGAVLNIHGIGPSGRRGTSYANNTNSSGAGQISAVFGSGTGNTVNVCDMILAINPAATMTGTGHLADAYAANSATINLYDCVGSGPKGVPIIAENNGTVNVCTRLAGAIAYSFPSIMGAGGLHG